MKSKSNKKRIKKLPANKSRTFLQDIKSHRKNLSKTSSSPQKATGYLGKVRDKKPEYKNTLLSDLMTHIPDVIYFKDTTGKLIMVNEAHAKGLGIKPKEVIGKTDFDFFSKKRAERMAKDDRYVIKTGKPIIDKIERATRTDNIDNYVSTTKIPRYDDKGNIIGLIGITRDITRRRQFEKIREEKERTRKKLTSLEEMNKLKSEFISVVSHELRTPLAIIKEVINLISDEITGQINNKQRELLIKAKTNIKRIRHLIDELLDISRIESGQLKLHYSLVNLNVLLRDSSAYFKNLAHTKDIKLNYHLPRKDINIFIDTEKINQVIINLINNAIRYTEQGEKIDIEVKTLENKVRVGIIDTGIGIAKTDLQNIFNKYVQVARLEQRKGLGLGLSISRELIEKHDGEIWAESKLGIGSKFYFTLPRFYTISLLNKEERNKINLLLNQEIPFYLVNLLIVNFKEFKKKINVSSKKLFSDLEIIINDTISNHKTSQKEKPQKILADTKIGEFGIIFPEWTEDEVSKICSLLRKEITEYFIKNKIENVFVNLGVLSYPKGSKAHTTLHLLSNLSIKKIYIGPEIRKFRRVKYKLDLEIILPEHKTETVQSLDLSLGGICFETKISLRTDSLVMIKLKLPTRKTSLYIQGRVVWIKNIEQIKKHEINKYKIGVEFINLKDKDTKALSKFISSIIK